jgi:hypothetical protein
MADRSIKLVPASSGGGAAFQPDLPGYNPGDAMPAQQDDLVSWNNTTNETHQPWQTDSEYKPLSDAWVAQYSYLYLSDEIPAQESSTPAYDVATPGGVSLPDSWTVYYYCKTHPNRESERGTIAAKVPPTS